MNKSRIILEPANKGSTIIERDRINLILDRAGARGLKGEQGEIGPPGTPGLRGLSAYEVWLEEGNEGTVDDYLASIKGDTGEVTQDEFDAHKEEIATQRQQDNLKVATVEKELNDYQSTIANVNVNQEAKQKVTGYGIVSLPKNSANGQVSVGVKGQTAKNEVGNGNFVNGRTGWFAFHGTQSVTNKINIVTGNGIDVRPSINNTHSGKWKNNVKYFVKSRMRVTNQDCNDSRLNVRLGSADALFSEVQRVNNPIQNQWYEMFGIISRTDTNEEPFLVQCEARYIDKTIANGKVMEVQEVFAIDMGINGSELYNLTADQMNARFPHFFDGTKSTISASRLKSVGKNLLSINDIVNGEYIIITTGVPGYNATRTRSKYISIKSSTAYSIKINGITTATEIYLIWLDSKKQFISWSQGMGKSILNTISPSNACYVGASIVGDGVTKAEVLQVQLEQGTVATPYEPYTESTQYLPNVGELRSLPNGVCDEIKVSGGKAELIQRVGKSELEELEELAKPIITPIQTSGNLISYPSGTVYVENVVADAGIYTTKFDIKELQLPIKSIDKLIKYNFETGVQTVLDTSLAVINANKLSFTHPGLTDKDMVFVDYYYDVEGTLGETTIEYLDSRHTIKDSVNNKFYKWDIKSANGVPTVELTEVL